MDVSRLRALWQVISHLPPDSMSHMTYEELTANLISELGRQRPLSKEDWLTIRSYLMQKELLVRELLVE